MRWDGSLRRRPRFHRASGSGSPSTWEGQPRPAQDPPPRSIKHYNMVKATKGNLLALVPTRVAGS